MGLGRLDTPAMTSRMISNYYITLKLLLQTLWCPGENLRNAGNDAYFVMKALLANASEDATRLAASPSTQPLQPLLQKTHIPPIPPPSTGLPAQHWTEYYDPSHPPPIRRIRTKHKAGQIIQNQHSMAYGRLSKICIWHYCFLRKMCGCPRWWVIRRQDRTSAWQCNRLQSKETSPYRVDHVWPSISRGIPAAVTSGQLVAWTSARENAKSKRRYGSSNLAWWVVLYGSSD